MFTVGHVHTWDHDSGYSVAGTRNLPRGVGGSRVLLYAHPGRRSRGASTPRGTPGGPQAEPKF